MSSLMSFSYVPPPVAIGVLPDAETFVTDPVCGRRIALTQVAARAVYRDVMYHFCSASCHKRFTWQAGNWADAPIEVAPR